MRLPKQTLFLFILSAVIFVSGAIGFEMLAGWQAELNGRENLLHCLLYTCEEVLEMLGVVMFIYALLAFIAREISFVTLTIKK